MTIEVLNEFGADTAEGINRGLPDHVKRNLDVTFLCIADGHDVAGEHPMRDAHGTLCPCDRAPDALSDQVFHMDPGSDRGRVETSKEAFTSE